MLRYSVARAAIRRPAPCDMAQESYDTHDRHATRRAVGACIAIQSLYRDRGDGREAGTWLGVAIQCATRPDRPAT